MPDFARLRHLLAGIFAIAMLFLVAPGGASHAEALSNCSVTNTTFDQAEQDFLNTINNYRKANGLQPLTVSANLNRAAELMVADLAKRPVFSHTDSLGRGPQQRIAECGGAPWFGENLAAGSILSTAQSAFSVWRSSGGHNRNMLLADYKQIGIARYYAPGSRYAWYWATMFSVGYDGTSTSTGTGLVNPAPGGKLSGTMATFVWTDTGANEYWLTVGTTFGGYDIYSASLGLARQTTVNQPADAGQDDLRAAVEPARVPVEL